MPLPGSPPGVRLATAQPPSPADMEEETGSRGLRLLAETSPWGQVGLLQGGVDGSPFRSGRTPAVLHPGGRPTSPGIPATCLAAARAHEAPGRPCQVTRWLKTASAERSRQACSAPTRTSPPRGQRERDVQASGFSTRVSGQCLRKGHQKVGPHRPGGPGPRAPPSQHAGLSLLAVTCEAAAVSHLDTRCSVLWGQCRLATDPEVSMPRGGTVPSPGDGRSPNAPGDRPGRQV